MDIHISNIMDIYNSITDVDLQFNDEYSKFTIMYGYARKIIDNYDRIMDVNI